MSWGTITNNLLGNISDGSGIVTSGLLDTVNSIYTNTAIHFESYRLNATGKQVLLFQGPSSFFSVMAISSGGPFLYTVSLQVGMSAAGVASNYITVTQANDSVMVNHNDAIPMPSNYFALNCSVYAGGPGSSVLVIVGFRP